MQENNEKSFNKSIAFWLIIALSTFIVGYLIGNNQLNFNELSDKNKLEIDLESINTEKQITNSNSLSAEELFKKDEYCRETYSKSFIEDYEKKLVGKTNTEWERIELVDIFFSPSENECYGVYDYKYSNEKYTNINVFERRIAKAVSADNIVYTFKMDWDRFLTGEEEEYINKIEELKSF